MTDGLRKRTRGDYESRDLNIFEWSIDNFREAFKNIDDGEKMTSPVFVGKSTGLPNSFWRIEVWPKEKRLGAKERHLDVCLEFQKELNQCNPFVKASYEAVLLDINHQEASLADDDDIYEYTDDEIEEEAEFGFDRKYWRLKMATHSQLLNDKSNCLDDDVLRVQVKVWIRNEEVNAETSEIQKKDKLREDLSQLLVSSQFSDVTIEVEDCTFKAYKGILSCRSPVFSAMFQNDMSESRTSTIKIEDFSKNTVQGMLKYIYWGNVEIVEEDFMELLKIADKYELKELKEACIKAAILKMSSENVIDILILGDMYNIPELKYRAMAFINGNKCNPMFSQGNENGAFEKFVEEHPKLLLEMYKNLRNDSVDVHYSGDADESIEEVTRITTNGNNNY